MTAEPDRIRIPPDSDLARGIKSAGESILVDTGERTYRLTIDPEALSPPSIAEVAQSQAGIREAAGGWEGLVDAEAFKTYIAQRRRTRNRPAVRL